MAYLCPLYKQKSALLFCADDDEDDNNTSGFDADVVSFTGICVGSLAVKEIRSVESKMKREKKTI